MNNMYYIVGPVCYRLTSTDELEINEAYKQYFFDSPHNMNNIIECEIKITNEFDSIDGNLIYQNPERLIFEKNGLETRVHFWNQEPVGIYRELADNKIRIEFISNKVDILFLEMFALEKYLLKENAVVLHSSFIQYKNEGIVFTAPSGTGKSTQANLWKEYENAQIVNGDKSVLWWNDEEERFIVCGLPFCGSSDINENMCVPLKAIVFLSQANKNNISITNKDIAKKNLFKEMSINRWNINSIDQVLDLIERITDKIRLLSLECTISQEAVEITKQEILKDA